MISDVNEIKKTLNDIKCFILDMDGTIYLGEQLFDFTKSFLDKVQASGKDFYFFTNNSSKNTDVYVKKLNHMGINVDSAKVMISNDVIIRHINENYDGKSAYVVGTDYLIKDFEKAGIKLVYDENADFTVLGFDTTLTYEKLKICCDIVRKGRPILGVNPDFNCPMENNNYIPDCGSIARLVEASTGVLPEFFGKPSKHSLEYIKCKTGLPENSLCFVGDRLYTDIAIACGTESKSILVLTGESTLEDLKSSPFKPSIVVQSLKEITALL